MDHETKLALLQERASAEGVLLPDDVAIWLAARSVTSASELETLLVRVVAYASLSSRQLSVPLARKVFRNVCAERNTGRPGR